MGQAKLRKLEIEELKTLGNDGKNIAINFKFMVIDKEEYQYNLLSVYTPKIVKLVENNTYDNDKCLDIIMENSQPLLVQKAGNAKPADMPAIEQCMRNISLAVMRMAILDPYKAVGLQPDIVLDMTLEEDENGNVGFNLLGDGHSMLLMQRGVQSKIDRRQADGVDFICKLA